VIVKERPKDIILHTCKVTYSGWEWFVTLRRTQLRQLFLSLKDWEKQQRPTRRGFKHRVSGIGKGMPVFVNNSKRKEGKQVSKSKEKQFTPVKATNSKLNIFQKKNSKVMDDIESGMITSNISETEPYSQYEMNQVKVVTQSVRNRAGSFADDHLAEQLEEAGNEGKTIRDGSGTSPVVHTILLFKKFLSRKMYRSDEESLQYQRDLIENYFDLCFNSDILRNASDLLDLLEVSPMSFREEMGPSYKEGYVKVRCSADSRDKLLKSDTERAICGQAAGFNCCCCVCFCFKKKITTKRRVRAWAIIKNGSISFYNNRKCERLLDVIMFQPSTVISDQLVVTGTRNGAVIIDSAWMAEFKFDSNITQKQWLAAMNAARNRCPWVTRDRFQYSSNYTGSMTTRGSHSAMAQWFTTPQDLWEEIYESLLAAEDQVFMAGWWISPEIFLKRPGLKFPESRLDAVLEKIAQKGVKVYILQYKEPKVMPLNSLHTREKFLSLDHRGNIQYLGHGDFTFPYMWSHHEKLVIIDQDIAFVGGVDLSFGRWDTPEYRICDDGTEEEQLWLGKDYQNPRIKDYVDMANPFDQNPVTGTQRNKVPRMPRRDIHMRLFGQSAVDVAWHFIQRWNYTRYVSHSQRTHTPLQPSGAGAMEMLQVDDVNDQSPSGVTATRSSKQLLATSAATLTHDHNVTEFWNKEQSDLDSRSRQERESERQSPRGDKDSAISRLSRGFSSGRVRLSSGRQSGRSSIVKTDVVGGTSTKKPSLGGFNFRRTIFRSNKNGSGVAKPDQSQLKNSKELKEAMSKAACSLESPVHHIQDQTWKKMSAKQRNRSLVENVNNFGVEAIHGLNLSKLKSNMKQGDDGDSDDDDDDDDDDKAKDEKDFAARFSNAGKTVSAFGQGKSHEQQQQQSGENRPMAEISKTLSMSQGIEEEPGQNGTSGGGGIEEHRAMSRRRSTTAAKIEALASSGNLSGRFGGGDQGKSIDVSELNEPTDENGSSGARFDSEELESQNSYSFFAGIPKSHRNSTYNKKRQVTHMMLRNELARFRNRDSGSDAAGKKDDETGTKRERVQSLLKKYKGKTSASGVITPVRCHVVRSLGSWSSGLIETEHGIQDAYKHFINNSQHFIYIENQFFISGCSDQNGKKSRIANNITHALYLRIFKAHLNKQKFRVIVLLPLLPAMEGAVKGGAMSSISGVMYWQYYTICRGGNSLIEKLVKSGVNPDDYLYFIGLRTYGQMQTGYQTEQIYIHSKLMIVDDKVTIIGSANINDRSMTGAKDSEVCIVSEDTELVSGLMDGAPFMSGEFARSLRYKVWSEMLGLNVNKAEDLGLIEDPICDATWNLIKGRAKDNTSKFEMVFKDLVPSNRVKQGSDLVGDGAASGTVYASAKQKKYRRMSAAQMEPLLLDKNLQEEVEDEKETPGTNNSVTTAKIVAEVKEDHHHHSNFVSDIIGGLTSTRKITKANTTLKFGQEELDAMKAMNKSDGLGLTSQRKNKSLQTLKGVKGYIVEWPLDFLMHDFKNMHPTGLPAVLFQ